MSRFRTLLSFVVLVTASSAPIWAQSGRTASGFVPRHERLAASVLRRQQLGDVVAPATEMSNGAARATAVSNDRVPIFDPSESPNMDELAAPLPPTAFDSIPVNGAVTYPKTDYPVGGFPDSSYSIGETIVDPAWPGDGASSSFSGPVIGSSCGPSCDGGCDGRCGGGVGCGNCWTDSFSLLLGVEGFRSGFNQGESGSFGFQEGFNWGSSSIWAPIGMNTQIGFRATQSDFNGSSFTTDNRIQYFFTAGFFKKSVAGWQGGVVFDYLHDEWFDAITLGQLRGELSWATPNGSSAGVWVTQSLADETAMLNGQSATYETQDIYAFFYRIQAGNHRLGQWRVFAGFTGESDGIVGSEFKVPLAGTWSLEPEFTYIVPDESTGNGAIENESWSVAFNLVWYPGRAVNGINYAQLPLFDVAGNGSMITVRK